MSYTISLNETNLSKICLAIRQAQEGRLDCSGTFTLDAGATTTVVKARTCTPDSRITFDGTTANAAAAKATTYILDADKIAGQFTVTHASAGTTDRTFDFICIG